MLIDKQELPYTIVNNTVRFFAGSPGLCAYCQAIGNRSSRCHCLKSAKATGRYRLSVRRGLPNGFGQAISRDLWQILADHWRRRTCDRVAMVRPPPDDDWSCAVDGCSFLRPRMEEGVVTFARAWVLLLLVLPAALVLWQWTRAPRRLNLLLKAAMLTLVILALAEPAVTISENKVSTMVLVDTSAGLSRDDLARASELVSKMDSARGRNWMRVIPFARATRSVAAEEHNEQMGFPPNGGRGGACNGHRSRNP